MGLFDAFGADSWIGRNADWLKPVAVIGGSLYINHERNKQRKRLAERARQQAEQAYQQDLAAWEAEQAYAGGGHGGGGGGGGGGSGALRSGYNRALGYLKPYVETGKRLLPYQEEAYKQGMEGLKSLYGSVLTPEQIKLATVPQKSLWESDIPLPDYMKGK
jgi:hypothetical protein